MKIKNLLALTGLFLCTVLPGFGQSQFSGGSAPGAKISGNPVGGNCASWANSTTLQDAGGVCGGAPPFGSVTTGTNTTNLFIGTGGVLSTSGTGVINANELNGTLLSGLSTGILKVTTGTGVPSNAASGDVIGLFSACSGIQYLGADGTCHVGATGATANGGLVLTSTTLGLITTCSNNQVLQWNTVAWVCASPTTGTVTNSNTFTAGLPIIGNSTAAAFASAAYVDVAAPNYPHTGGTDDICTRIDRAFDSTGGIGAENNFVDARGLTTALNCSINPLAKSANGAILLLPSASIPTDALWVQQPNTHVIGSGRTNSASEGTTIIASTGAHTLAEAAGKKTTVHTGTGSELVSRAANGTVTITFPNGTVFPADNLAEFGRSDGQPLQIGCANVADQSFVGVWRIQTMTGSGGATPQMTYKQPGLGALTSVGNCTVILYTPLYTLGPINPANVDQPRIRLEGVQLDVNIGTTHYGLVGLTNQNAQEDSEVEHFAIRNWNFAALIYYSNAQNAGMLRDAEIYAFASDTNCNPTGSDTTAGSVLPTESMYIIDKAPKGIEDITTTAGGNFSNGHCLNVNERTPGSVTSGIFSSGETVIQGTSNGQAVLVGTVTGSNPMITGTITGTTCNGTNCPVATDWVGQTSGAHYTPSDQPTPTVPLITAVDMSVVAPSRIVGLHCEHMAYCVILGRQDTKTSGASTGTTIINLTGAPNTANGLVAPILISGWYANHDYNFLNTRANTGMTKTIVNEITNRTYTDSVIAQYAFDKIGTLISECGSFVQFPCEQDGGFYVANVGAASTPSLHLNGTMFTGGTGTTTFPNLYINEKGSTAPTDFSTSGTEFGINAVNAFAGNFFDFKVNGGTSIASMNAAGTLFLNNGSISAFPIVMSAQGDPTSNLFTGGFYYSSTHRALGYGGGAAGNTLHFVAGSITGCSIVSTGSTTTIAGTTPTNIAGYSCSLPGSSLSAANKIITLEQWGFVTTGTATVGTFTIDYTMGGTSCTGAACPVCSVTTTALTASQTALPYHFVCKVGILATGSPLTVDAEAELTMALTAPNATPTLFRTQTTASINTGNGSSTVTLQPRATLSTNSGTATTITPHMQQELNIQ